MIENEFMPVDWPEANKSGKALKENLNEVNLSNNIVLFDDDSIFDFTLSVMDDGETEYECFIDTKEAIERAKKVFNGIEEDTPEDIFYGINWTLKIYDYDLSYSRDPEHGYFELDVDEFEVKEMKVVDFEFYKYYSLKNELVKISEEEYAEHLGLSAAEFKDLLMEAANVIELRPKILKAVTEKTTDLSDYISNESDWYDD